MSFGFVSIYFRNIGECHSILQYFLQICYKSQCPLPSALLYLRGPSSVGKARIFLLNAPCQVPYFTRGARPVHLDRQMYSFFFKVMPLAACSWFSAATGSFLCLNEFLPGVLDYIVLTPGKQTFVVVFCLKKRPKGEIWRDYMVKNCRSSTECFLLTLSEISPFSI